ncbi:LysR family transcriptional regulator [Nakamurella sp. PAMC28650]|jgi:LysR family transcriptional activator of glutamate synthase operon|uniref:LysR family transcriptional regulator n=1 Tax=Nakamurella sp. PAMC28650 TaxID=2762325 RepID=UPI00164E8527|nr:LysR family transcriptional regulator [Nakamurella sp. PAMC28650]QNK82259.1 LysR family transcriptional regulator [Nakamurella sp. PAMC28650]
MDTDALRWFQQIADGVTMTEVSEIEFITQSGVSRALSRLEADVGTQLLRRTGRNLRMTSAGAAFKRHVDALLHQLDDGLAAVDQLIDPETGIVALASQLSLGTWLVPNLVGSFRRTHADVRFELQQVRDNQTTAVLQDTRLDLEITTVRPTDRTVTWHPLLTEPLWLAVPQEHELATRRHVRLSEVSREPFLMLRRPSLLRHQTEELCEQAGFEPAVAFEGEDIPTLRGFVTAGLGVAVVPALHLGSPEALTGVVHHLQITDAGAAREIGLGWSSERKTLPSAELFRQHIIDRSGAGDLPAVAPMF